MSPQSPNPSPSHAVERIREILVGRQLDRLEQRVSLLEQPGLAHPSSGWTYEPRLEAVEAQVEALQDRLHRIAEHHRVENESREQRHQEEIRRLAEKIQLTAHGQPGTEPATTHLESRIGQWLTDWQSNALARADQRERQLIDHLRAELTRFREWVSSEIQEKTQTKADRDEIEKRLHRIAAAARSLADAATAPLSEPEPFSLP